MSESEAFREIAADLLAKVKGGSSLGDAMAQRAVVFPSFYTGLVRAGEAGGSLETVMGRLADNLEKSEALKSKVRSAMAYPMIVLVLTALSLVILMTQVVPEFKPLFSEAGDRLPWMTRLVLTASDVTRDWGWLAALGMCVLILALVRFKISASIRDRRDAFLLQVPLLGDFIRKGDTTRFCRALGTLLENGVSLLRAVEITSGTLTNGRLAKDVRGTTLSISKGKGLARSLSEASLLPPLALQLIEVGEESGHLEPMLHRVAEIYDLEVEQALQRVLALLLPLTTILLGIIIALVVGAMLTAILSIYDLPL